MVDDIEDSLDLVLRWNNDPSLGVAILISISMLGKDWTSLFGERALVVVKYDLFANSLMGATMQGGGKRERSDGLQRVELVNVAHQTIT